MLSYGFAAQSCLEVFQRFFHWKELTEVNWNILGECINLNMCFKVHYENILLYKGQKGFLQIYHFLFYKLKKKFDPYQLKVFYNMLAHEK